MAEPIVSPLLEVVIDKLGSGLWKELRLLRGVKKDILKLQSTLSTIKDVLEDAEQRSISHKPLCSWLKKLKDAAYDADDVMDEIQTEALRRRMENHGHPLKGQVRDFFSSHNHIAFRHRIALKIKDLLERLNAIAEERRNFHLTQGSVSERPRHEETHSVVIASEVYGRGEDKCMVLKFLLNENNDEDLSVLAIIGLGGLGKTTLAQLVYNDESIKSSFDLRGWICVSDEFDVRGITRKIIHSINKEAKCDHLELDPLGQRLRETLGGQKFILVLDDVWNEDRQKWDKLKSLLRCGNKGSKIVVTTRSEHVASVMGSVLSHRLKGLSADDCWNLFRERAFGLRREKESPVLIEIGKKIVNKCGGLPLAAKALGSLMGSKREEHEWLAIQNSDIWTLNDENEILPALRLSYYHLPSYLKQCFVYCSLFPKDYVFETEELISLWIGEGFVQSSNEGAEYFNSLSRRSFFDQLEQEYDYINRADKYKMHDLMHDLACSAAKDGFCMTTVHEEEVKVIDNCRYLSLVADDTSPNVLGLSSEPKKLRSLLLLNNGYIFKEIKWDVSLRQSHIRVLDLHWSATSVLPSAICKLKLLRLLNLSHTLITKLPQTICSMYNLSTLILAGCTSLEELPSTISRLPNLCILDLSYCLRLRELPGGMSQMNNLTHLDICGCSELRDMPVGMGRLTNLQTMSRFIVGEENGCRITELKGLNQIRGHLEIVNLHKVRSSVEAEEANLRAKVNVKHLELIWDGEEPGRETEVIESLHPSPNLEVLKISGYPGSRLPSWMMMMSGSTEPPTSLFRNLVELELCNQRRCEGLPALGQLPLLKVLEIRGMDGVRRIGGEEFYGQPAEVGGRGGRDLSVPFPVLKMLRLKDMSNLEEWVVEAGEIERERMFPSLTRLTIRGCPKLTRIQPGLPVSIEYLEITDSRNEELLPAGSLAGLSRVRYIYIVNCKTLSPTSSWWEELHYLTALETLRIYDCEEMTCLPEGIIQHHFPSLQTLDISNLTSLGDPQQQTPPLLFTSLHHLGIWNCTELTSLPEWLGRLTSLQSLYLSCCPNLEMLPEGLQHLTALQRLKIGYCPLLARRCERERGSDWHKIAHIPNIHIDTIPEEEPQQETTRRRRRGGCNWIRGGGIGLASCLRGHQGPPLA